MQAIKSTSHLVGTAKTVVGVRKFANSSSSGMNPASKDMSKANWAGDKINSPSVEENNPFKNEEDLHGRDLDEQTREAIMRNIFPRNDTNMKTSSIDWSKKEKKAFTDPAHSALDKIAEGVEKRGAKASEKFKAPKDLTEGAANFASGADRAAHAFDGVRTSGATMSAVGSRIAEMAHAPSIGNDPTQGQKTTTASMGEGEAETRDKSMDSTSTGMMGSVKESFSEGMERFTEKMSGMGSSISDKMKPLENLGEKIHVPTEMPQSLKNARETMKHAAESIKESLPKSLDEAKDMVKNAMPSMEGAKNMAESAKEKIESSLPSSGAAKSTMRDVKEKWNETKEAAMDKFEDAKESMPSTKSAMQGAQEKWSEVKEAAKDKFEDAKESMPSKSQFKGMAADASEKMSQAKDFVAEKATEAKETVEETVSKANTSGVYEQFKQGMATMKEAMKPIVDYSTEKIREGAAVAAEKIPPMATSLKESLKSGASAVMHSNAVESAKENLSASANKAYEKAKDSASTLMTGKSDAEKMEIMEETTTVSKGKKEQRPENLKDQEMSSSDIFKA